MKYLSRNKPLFKAEEVDGNKLVTLTSEIRETVEKIDRLKRQANDLGF